MVTILHSYKMHSKIFLMPPEILIHILSYLEYRRLLIVQRVCRALRDIVRTSLELRYIIELGADNLHDNPAFSRDGSAPFTTQDRLNTLLDRRKRWRTLDWTQKVTVPLAGACQAYELVAGVFAKSMRGHGNEDLWPPGSRHLVATWLPTRNGPQSWPSNNARRVVRDDLGVPTRDFAIDPTQDVLALVEVDVSSKIMVHVRTLTSQAIHPLAAQSPLISPAPSSETLQQLPVGSCFVQIVDDVIGMFFWHSGSSLRIWNWRTGAVLVSQNEQELPQGAWDFAFLGPRAYMITCIGHSGSLGLFTIDDNSDSPEAQDCSTHMLTLQLPPLLAHRQLRSISTHSAPHLAHPESLDTPFVHSQRHRIHLVQLHYGDLLPQYTLYVKNEYFMDILEQMHERTGVYDIAQEVPPSTQTDLHFATPGAPELAPWSSGHAGTARVLDWDQWGPQNTRFLQQSLHFQWLRYIHGHRIVLPPATDLQPHVLAMPPQHEGPREQELRIFDFHVHPRRVDDPCDALMDVEREQYLKDDAPPWQYDIETDPTILPARDLFCGPVTSMLPYSVSRLKGVWRYTGFMIDDQRLVGMKDTMFFNASACDLDVFTM